MKIYQLKKNKDLFLKDQLFLEAYICLSLKIIIIISINYKILIIIIHLQSKRKILLLHSFTKIQDYIVHKITKISKIKIYGDNNI